jgi:uncharacterized protein (TIGR00645 family)
MPNQPPAPLAAATKPSVLMTNVSKFFYRLDAPIFASRWLLYVIHIGLCLCLAVYCWRFTIDLLKFVIESPTIDGEDLMLHVLSFIDAAMVANLLVMINIGGYQIFIHRLHIEARVRPQWLDHLDSMMMKVKVSVSIASITGIQVLRDFMNAAHTPTRLIEIRGVLHFVCLVSALSFAYIWKVTRDNPQPHPDSAAPAPAASEHNDKAPGDSHTASPHEGGEHAERREDAHH